jgi:hypothetical protein
MANSEGTDTLLLEQQDVRRGVGLISFASGLLKGGNLDGAADVLAIAAREVR